MAARGVTPLTAALRRTLAAHGVARRTGVPVEEVLGNGSRTYAVAGPSRRDVLKAAGAVAAGATLGASMPARRANAATNPSVLVVGAGLAGLRAAHYLWRVKGIAAAVYEGNNRPGGRCWSLRDYFPGLVVEHGGQLINTDHNAVRNLATSLGLSLDPVYGGSYGGLADKYRIGGADYPYDAANADWGEVYSAMRAAQRSAPYPQTFDTHTDAGVALDAMTVDQWLDANVPGGLSSRFARLMQSNAVAEYGLDPDQQSALNLVYLLGWNPQNSLDPLNGSDEKYTVHGGNDQLVTRMVDQLPAGAVRYGHRLVALRQSPGGPVRCSFQVRNKVVDVTADRVVLALPFTMLRDVDLTGAGFSTVTTRALGELGLGANAKIHAGVSRRPWVEQGYGGASYTELAGFQCGWDDSVNAPLPTGAFVFFPGGRQVADGWSGATHGPAPAAQVSAYLAQLEPMFPGVTAAYTGKAYRDFWWSNPWSHGAYTCPRPGQYTTLFGAGATPEGNVHFAGEHTSLEYFGYLNGAVETGERAARAIAG